MKKHDQVEKILAKMRTGVDPDEEELN